MVIIGFAMMCYLALIGALILLVRWEPQHASRGAKTRRSLPRGFKLGLTLTRPTGSDIQ